MSSRPAEGDCCRAWKQHGCWCTHRGGAEPMCAPRRHGGVGYLMPLAAGRGPASPVQEGPGGQQRSTAGHGGQDTFVDAGVGQLPVRGRLLGRMPGRRRSGGGRRGGVRRRRGLGRLLGAVSGGSSGPYPAGSSGPYPAGSSGPYPDGSSGPYPAGSSEPYPVGSSGPYPDGSDGPYPEGSSGPYADVSRVPDASPRPFADGSPVWCPDVSCESWPHILSNRDMVSSTLECMASNCLTSNGSSGTSHWNARLDGAVGASASVPCGSWAANAHVPHRDRALVVAATASALLRICRTLVVFLSDGRVAARANATRTYALAETGKLCTNGEGSQVLKC